MRSPFRVTPKYIDFLFNREETVVGFIPESMARVIALEDVKREVRADVIRHNLEVEFAERLLGEGDWQLPPSDESKVGDD